LDVIFETFEMSTPKSGIETFFKKTKVKKKLRVIRDKVRKKEKK
jgi:hypothetical protein